MTDSGNSGVPAKNTGGDYPAPKSCFVHYRDRRIYFGRKEEAGRSIRRFFQVPENETLYREVEGGEPVVILDDPETMFPLAEGQRYFSEPIPVPAALPEAGGKPSPYLKEPGAETVIGEDGRLESEDAPEPAPEYPESEPTSGGMLGAILEKIEDVRKVAGFALVEAKRAHSTAQVAEREVRRSEGRTVEGPLKRIEDTARRIEAQNKEAQEGRGAIFDEAKRARTLSEENEALGRANSRQATDLLEKVVALKAIAAKTDTRLWNQAQALTDILRALSGPDALTERLGRIEKAVGSICSLDTAAIDKMLREHREMVQSAVGPKVVSPLPTPEEPVFAGPPPEKPHHRIVLWCNGRRFEHVGAYEADSSDLRQLFVLGEDDALLEVDGSGTTLDRILDGATVMLADEMRFVTVPNGAFVPRR